MRCPNCDWTAVSYVVETGQWSCKRCKHNWSESALAVRRPSAPVIRLSAGVKTKSDGKKAKPKAKKTSSKKTTSPKGKKKVSRRR